MMANNSTIDSFDDFIDYLQNDAPIPFELSIVIFAFLVIILLSLCVCCCFRRRQRKFRDRVLRNQQQYTRGGSIRTMTKRLDATPSNALSKFSDRFSNPSSDGYDDNDFSISVQNDDDLTPATFNGRPLSKRMPEAYGRIDKETQDRIRSIRMSARHMKPIIPGALPPNAKALKMMGITEEESKRDYSLTVEERMKRVAQGAGGGLYNPGLATAKFGGSIADGFAKLQNRNAERNRKRKEERLNKEKEKNKKKEDFRQIKLKPTGAGTGTSGNTLTSFLSNNKSQDDNSTNAASDNGLKSEKPGSGNRLTQFLQTSNPNFRKVEDHTDDEEETSIVEPTIDIQDDKSDSAPSAVEDEDLGTPSNEPPKPNTLASFLGMYGSAENVTAEEVEEDDKKLDSVL